MNYLLDCKTLHNRFFAMRHGESEANRQSLIVSSPAAGINGYGLSETGRRQAAASVAAAGFLSSATRIFTSDFKRALETAQIVHDHLGCSEPITPRPQLRERFFGDWEQTRHENYEKVWRHDAEDAGHTEHGVESVLSVMARATTLVLELDQKLRDQMILLVAHGDVLQILQTAFSKQPPQRHRALAHLQTAEIRELILTN